MYEFSGHHPYYRVRPKTAHSAPDDPNFRIASASFGKNHGLQLLPTSWRYSTPSMLQLFPGLPTQTAPVTSTSSFNDASIPAVRTSTLREGTWAYHQDEEGHGGEQFRVPHYM
jgi:hypothetical protein